ncbi:histidine-type phosphatase [Marinomonas rhizomae]|uniref:histidine-type phosphatase n=1 Tax=Marinomonas rhizomae TaxID=491948 RepID=UPI002104131C|nr:histidine-type phosphatase [Marinomonas rhizomae]UTV99713.1 histidine-type phosphatase [Marinomonas rhizomae]
MDTRTFLPILGMLALTGCSSVGTTPNASTDSYIYGTKSVYVPQESAENYSSVPDNYTLIYTELVARHGSRALSSPKYDDISLKIWQAAQEQNALTPLGERLGVEIARLMAANKKMGYGNLSELGKQEHIHIGERMAQRNASLLNRAVKNQQQIAFEYSGKDRARDSGLAFVQGLENINPALAPLISKPVKNKAQLYFHKQDNNKDYQNYKDENPQLREAIEHLFDQPKTHQVAREMLERVYKPAFVDQLEAGQLSFLKVGKKKASVYNDVEAAIQLFNLYLIAPGLAGEAGTQPWNFTQFITPKESQWLSYVLDGEDFYEKGPSFSDTNITYKMASVLEDDFFNEIKGVQDGTNTKAAKIRFAHAETIIPFAAQMQLKGSEAGVSRDLGYTLQTSPWRGGWVAPYSANIQWDVYRNQTGSLLVKMLYNEQEIAFKDSCKPISAGSYFYQFSELTRCYNKR